MRWFTKSDELSLNISELNFTKKIRGKKPAATTDITREVFLDHWQKKVLKL